jgi:hypothetical protein
MPRRGRASPRFYVAFERWLDEPHARELLEFVSEGCEEL